MQLGRVNICREIIIILLSLLTLFYLPSCKVDGEEHITIHANGNTEFSVNYQVPKVAISLLEGQQIIDYVRDLAKRHKEIQLSSASCLPAGSRTIRLKVHLSCDSAIDLERILPKELERITNTDQLSDRLKAKVAIIIGDIQLKPNISTAKVNYKRTIIFYDLIKSELNNLRGMDGSRLLGESEFRYSLTTHKPSSEHNAHIVSNSGKTLTWKMPLRKHYHVAFHMQASLPVPWAAVFSLIPAWVWLVVTLTLFFMAWCLWKGLRRLFK